MPGLIPFQQLVPRLAELFEADRDPARAARMGAYMRGQLPFLGIAAPRQKALLRQAKADVAQPTQRELADVSRALWTMAGREYQYAAIALLIANVRVCDASFLPTVRELLVANPWWDTVDALAARVVGPLVAASPELGNEMDAWVGSANPWLARSAIVHQLGFKGATEAGRLFGYCRQRSSDRDFFIRKAIGWALREYSKTDAEAVRRFVRENAGSLSGLSQREAMLWLNGGRSGAKRVR